MKTRLMLYWIVTLLLVSTVSRAEERVPDLGQVTTRVVKFTNEFREEQGRGRVTVNEVLTKTADDFAHYLARTDTFSHTADGQEPWERAKKHGYAYCTVSENIEYQYNSAGFESRELAETFVEAWKHSPGHRKNMLDPDVTETGVAVARSEKTGRYYAVQLFGRPRSLELTFDVLNESQQVAQYTVDGQEFSVRPGVKMTHKACKPPRLEFSVGEKREDAGNHQPLRPRNHAHYVIREGADGAPQVEER